MDTRTKPEIEPLISSEPHSSYTDEKKEIKKKDNTPLPLDLLPIEVIQYLATYLTLNEILALRGINRFLFAAIQSTPAYHITDLRNRVVVPDNNDGKEKEADILTFLKLENGRLLTVEEYLSAYQAFVEVEYAMTRLREGAVRMDEQEKAAESWLKYLGFTKLNATAGIVFGVTGIASTTTAMNTLGGFINPYVYIATIIGFLACPPLTIAGVRAIPNCIGFFKECKEEKAATLENNLSQHPGYTLFHKRRPKPQTLAMDRDNTPNLSAQPRQLNG